MKRLLSVFLMLAMIFTLAPVGVFAADTDAAAPETKVEAEVETETEAEAETEAKAEVETETEAEAEAEAKTEETEAEAKTEETETEAETEKMSKEKFKFLVTLMLVGSAGANSKPDTPITSAQLMIGDTEASVVNVGDTLTLAVEPADATVRAKWTIGGKEIKSADAYTVTSFDIGKTVTVEVAGRGGFCGTVSDSCTVASKVQVTASDIMSEVVDSSPVVLTDFDNTTFWVDETTSIDVYPSSTITLSIENSEKSEEETSAAHTLVIEKLMSDTGAEAEAFADVTAVAVDVDLSVDDTPVHPVGDVTVTLSAEQLGLEAGTDLTNYTFSANHTNKNGDSEVVEGVLVEIDGVQYIRFELNGLSTIWIGNIPPRTVSFFNTEYDADNNINSIGSVVVKFGDLTPTREIPAPSRKGYLFCGWNYDMTRTPIITNLNVHAIWVAGEKMPSNNISAVFSEDTDAAYFEIGDGIVNVDSEKVALVPSGLDVKVTVYAPETAVKYYVGNDAAVVAAFNDADEYMDVPVFDTIDIVTSVTDENGLMLASFNTYYYKWVDADGNIISLQELGVRVANGTDSATSMAYTQNVDRGIGMFEVYLVDSDDATKDYVAYINNYLNGNATSGYTLRNNVSFDGYRNNYDFSAYDTLKLVFTPYEGESFDKNTVSATYEYYDGNKWVENYAGKCQVTDGKLIVTYPFDVDAMPNEYVDVFVSANGKTQDIYVYWDAVMGGSMEEDPEVIQCSTWAEVLAALKKVTNKKEYYIHCTDSSAITLSGALKIPANVDISLEKASGFTVAKGATLTFTDDRINKCGSRLEIRKGDFIVENGGVVTTSYVGSNEGNRWYPMLSAKNVTFKSGAKLTIPVDTLLYISPSYSNDDDGVFTLEKGAVATNNGNLNIQDFDVVNINGTLAATSYTYFYSDETNINGDVSMTVNGYGYMEYYGTVTVGENGKITVNNTNTKYSYTNLEIYAPFTNKGTIELKGKTEAVIMNNGYVNYNMGTISIEKDACVITSGTKFVNTGMIKGAGTVYASLGDDYTNYDDGTEYVYIDNDEYWDAVLNKHVYKLSDYSRYKYTHDPDKTVDVILYLAEIVNMGGGKCTVNVETEKFPEK